ncbi:MAG: glycosyltransferase family 2 protein [Acidobacteriota bacterium]|nr:glycosyltransferase family 2 protein [Acidobacteriota bacterium]
MLSIPELVVFVVLAFFLLLPIYWDWRLIRVLWHHSVRPIVLPTYLPRATALLSLRGADPSLIDCLSGLLNQDYPQYAVCIIVDSAADPAWEEVQRILARGHPANVQVRVAVLAEHRETCSLKLSGTLQAIAGLDEQIEVLALIDADVIPARNWLRSLVEPLHDPCVGATTSFPWYAPTDTSWGTLVRYVWMAAAVTQMFSFRIAWAGSLAFHARVFRHPRALERWSHSFSEDTGTFGLVRELGLALRFVPEVMAVNPESIDLRSCYTFIRRQLFVTRFQHVWWTPLWMLNVGIIAAFLGACGLLAAGLWAEDWTWVIGAASLLGAYSLAWLLALLGADKCIRRIVRRQRADVPAFPLSWKCLLAGPLTLGMHFGCLIAALRLKEIAWRGIRYDIYGPHQLRMLGYQPYRPADSVSQTGQSIL